MAVIRGVILWKIDGDLMRTARCGALPTLEYHVLRLSDCIIDGVYPFHRGIEVGAIGI